MKVLISVVSPEEAVEAVEGGADVVDMKDPSKGSLGAPEGPLLALIVRALRDVERKGIAISVALGDDPRSGVAMEIALVAEKMAVDYAKVGSLGLRNISEAVRAYKDLKGSIDGLKLVAVAYADYRTAKCLSPTDVLDAAYKSDYDVFMIDTLIKDGRSTFDHLSRAEILKIKRCAREKGMIFALAGSLRLEHAASVREIEPDVVGFRSAACNGNRVRGKVTRDNVRLLVSTYKTG